MRSIKKGRIKTYLTRINEVAEKLENPEANTNKNRIDKQSSARIIKRSLWANAKRQGGGGGKSQVSEMVNATLETGSKTESTSTKRAQDDEETDEDDDEEEEDKEESNRSRTEKRLKV